jgi:hypothetical protein
MPESNELFSFLDLLLPHPSLLNCSTLETSMTTSSSIAGSVEFLFLSRPLRITFVLTASIMVVIIDFMGIPQLPISLPKSLAGLPK